MMTGRKIITVTTIMTITGMTTIAKTRVITMKKSKVMNDLIGV